MITEVHRSDVRRHLKYPAIYYQANNGENTCGIYPVSDSQLEIRLNSLSAIDEARLTGQAIGALFLSGNAPNPGDQVTVQIVSADLTGGNESVVVTAGSGASLEQMAQSVVTALNLNTDLKTHQFYATRRGNEVFIVSPSIFTLSAVGTGNISVGQTAYGSKMDPSATVGSDDDGPIIKWGILGILNFLEGEIAGATQNLDTTKADVWTARADEVKQRQNLYRDWQSRLSAFIGIPINPASTEGWDNRVIL